MSLASLLPAGAAPRVRGTAPAVVTRRGLEMALGALWLLDGALQFQPAMFTTAFFNDTLGMANMGLPGPVSAALYRLTSMLAGHPVFWNAAFASLQVALGAGLLWAGTARLARPVSVGWALAVWVAGEGAGGLFMPGVSALNGAPGAALLYAVATVVLWPRRPDGGVAAAAAGLLRAPGALWCWAVMWAGLALLELDRANHSAVVPAAEVANIGEGEPGWLAALNHHAGQLIAGRGAAFAVAAGLAQLAIGLGVLRPRWRRAALGAGIAASRSATACSARTSAVSSPGRRPIRAQRRRLSCSPWRCGPGGAPLPTAPHQQGRHMNTTVRKAGIRQRPLVRALARGPRVLDSPTTRAAVTALILAGAALTVISGVIHLRLWGEPNGYRQLPTIGPLFLAQGISAVVIGLAAAAARRLVAVLAAAGMLASTAAGLVITIEHGLFGFQEAWGAPYARISLYEEIAGAVLLLIAAWPLARPDSIRTSPR